MHFQYTAAGGKFKHAYSQPFFHKVVYIMYDTLCFTQQTGFINQLPLLHMYDAYRLGPVS
jgi:hypothetical protein